MRKEIYKDIENFYHLDIKKITPLNGGWLNEKYVIECIQGNFVVKVFSIQRYSKKGLFKVEEAAKIQMLLQNDIATAKLLKVPMRHLENNLHYQVMTYVEGTQKNTKTVSKEELISLGKSTALLHQALQKLPTIAPLNGQAFLDDLWEYHYTLKDTINNDLHDQQLEILNSLEADFFDSKKQGLCHEDLAYDNIIFYNNEVSAILDFDRCKQSYYLHDIGRVILSFCFDENHFIKENITAFLEGYNTIENLTKSDIINALKMTWCFESPWWINKSYLEINSGKPLKFRNELLWLTNHFFELHNLI